jgi:rSAM/selenodomain-associated transferase 2
LGEARVTLSVVIPTLNAAATLSATLASLRGADEVIVSDGGSSDGTRDVAGRSGARIVESSSGRGRQLATGADEATGDWLLFLHADTALEPNWRGAVNRYIANPANQSRAAAFRFALDDGSAPARRLERMVAWRTNALALPYGDQGLLIKRDFYRSLGGFRALPLMEDVDLVRRIGRRRLVILPISARTSAARWQAQGWATRSLRNVACLLLYFIGVPPRLLYRLYG